MMKNTFLKIIIAASAWIFAWCKVDAQVNFALDFQTMHLWRGMEVADGVVLTSDLNVTDRQKRFCFGLWGGMNTQASYKEFDYYLSYTKGNFKFSLWDIYNFSPDADYNNKEAFNYKASETGRFIDATVAYRWSDKFPLSLNWSTIVFGRDRNRANESNRYSTFVYAEYPFWQKGGWDISAGIGGAFAICPGKDETGNRIRENFYGDTAGIVHLNLKAVYRLSVCQMDFPITLLTMWNPQSNDAFFQVGVRVLEF
ncbi:hypothetical protein [Phocaeicola sp.]